MSRRHRRRDESPVSFFSFQDVITSVTGILILVTLLLTLELVARGEAAPAAIEQEPSASELRGRLRDGEQQLSRLKKQTAELQAILGEAATASPVAAEEDVEVLEREIRAARDRGRQLRNEVAAAESELQTARTAAESDANRAAEAQSAAAESQRRLEAFRQSKRLVVLPGGDERKKPLLVECAGGGVTVASLEGDGGLRVLQKWQGEAVGELLEWARSRDAGTEYFLVMVRPDGVSAGKRAILLLREAGFDVGWEPLEADVQLMP